MPINLPRNATLANLSLPRVDAERFIRKVLREMSVQNRQGDTVIRIGVTGSGQAPNYRIETPEGQPIVAIDGANHKPWPEGSTFTGTENWSSATMTYADVQEALACVVPPKRSGASGA